ncbi:phosphotransferase family protein [Methylorubrum sp. SB2]|uniref:phosphotransferase family protein n=1 Tax=Methylorubrum subtropicum TaxID=3138812 RepID=UPI00313D917C
MIALGSASDPFERRVEAALERISWGGRPGRFALAAAPVASPTHRAVASDCVRVEIEGQAPVFLKIRHDDMAGDVLPWADAAAERAAACGVGPAVIAVGAGVLALEWLPAPWAYARLGDLQSPTLAAAVLDAKARLHASGPLGHAFSPFERVTALAREARAAGAPLPPDLDRLLAAAELARAAIAAAGIDATFCHNDGIASNVMLDRAGGVRLVDFDLAGDTDPWFDVGAFLNEACAFDADRRALIEHHAGTCREPLFARARLYGFLDDLMWGLWGITRAVTSPRPTIEFLKYAQWRHLRARTTLAQRDFETWLRIL